MVDIRELGSLCGGIFGKLLYELDKGRRRIRERWQEAVVTVKKRQMQEFVGFFVFALLACLLL